MSNLSDALEAMDKATPGEWATWQTSRDGCGYLSIGPETLIPGTHDAIVCDITSLLTANDADIANAKVIRASKLALAWIKEALPWLEGIKAGMDGLTHKPDDYRTLDALIARVKPEEVGMPNIETPEWFAEKLSDRQHTAPYIASLIAARDALIRAESAALLKTCGEALEGAQSSMVSHNFTIIAPDRLKEVSTALVALREARVLNGNN